MRLTPDRNSKSRTSMMGKTALQFLQARGFREIWFGLLGLGFAFSLLCPVYKGSVSSRRERGLTLYNDKCVRSIIYKDCYL